MCNNTSRWNFKKADWDGFSLMCEITPTDALFSADIDTFNERITVALISAAMANIPTIRPGKHKSGVPWWTPDCGTAIKAKEDAWKRANSSKSPDEHANYVQLRNKSRSTIRTAADEHWKEHCSTLNSNTTSRDLWVKANKMLRRNNKSKQCSALVDGQGNVVTDPTAKANLFSKHYEAASSDRNLSEAFLQHRREF